MGRSRPTPAPAGGEGAPPALRFDRNEWAGAFGDIGTDLPLIVGMILAAGLDSASVLFMFGAMQIATGVWYRMPMPVQPLKAMAAIVITQKLTGNVLYGGGLAIGLLMLVLTATRLIEWLARVTPLVVIRGIQFGLGLQLATLALREYVRADGVPGYVLAGLAFLATLALIGNRRYPAALVVIALGIIYAALFALRVDAVLDGVGLRWPRFFVPTASDVLTGLLVLALPQLPLSLGNSILATQQSARDFFPDRPLSVRKISATYAVMNLIHPFFSGIPTCHGSGGLVGHYTFGGRTGGSVVIYGSLYVLLGLVLSGGFNEVIRVFPLPVLGVLLLFEGLALMALLGRLPDLKADLPIALLVGLIAGSLPYGYVVAMLLGMLLASAAGRRLTRLAR
ncbi:MAG: putative sulfate/molybdate transporter [Armatimonadota bacterium]|nr:putative sulfate/molybdate transporter [Armatimonadota bacterium]